VGDFFIRGNAERVMARRQNALWLARFVALDKTPSGTACEV
jgi:hypothetical protein